jgi:beta-ureidopropionase / N-carbamoyl-L-amino-acid hydrolase
MKQLLTILLIIPSFFAFAQPKLKVNEQRIESRIFELTTFGKDANGRGYRVAYTKGDIEARAGI